jgi:hypothetical protein
MMNPGLAPGDLFLRRFAACTPPGICEVWSQTRLRSPAATSRVRLIAGGLSLGESLVAWIGCGDQAAGPLHGVAVVGVDRAAEEAGLVGGAVDASVRPGELVPAAHFDKTLDEGICHGFLGFLLMSMLLSSTYSEKSKMRVCFLVIGRGNKVSVHSHYLVTEGGVT